MRALKPVITAAGLRAVLRADHSGLAATISHISVGAGPGFDPDGDETALRSERARIAIIKASRPAPTTVHLEAVLDQGASFWIREVGVHLDDGTLLAIWSDPDTPLAYFTAGVPILLAFTLTIDSLPADAVTVIAGDLDTSLFIVAPLARVASVVVDLMGAVPAIRDEVATLRDGFDAWRGDIAGRLAAMQQGDPDRKAETLAILARLSSAVLDCLTDQADQGDRLARLTTTAGARTAGLADRIARVERLIAEQADLINANLGVAARAGAMAITAVNTRN